MAGVVWQFPANNNGDVDGGLNMSGAKKVVFMARGGQGGEVVNFSFGGTLGPYPDTDKREITDIVLSTNWQRFEIDLSTCDLTYISSFFGWIAARFHNPDGFQLYLDEIRIE
jgi:hypothetical protein